MTVRAANEGDVDAVVDLGKVMHGESVFAKHDFDRDHLVNYASHAINTPELFGLFVNEDSNGEIDGVVGGYLAPHYFSPNIKVAYDFLIYIHPSSRGGLAAARLMRKYEKWAKQAGAYEVSFAVFAGINNDSAHRFLRGLGYGQKAVVFKKEI